MRPGSTLDVLIDLAAVFTTAYDRSRVARRINYESGVTVPMKDADRQWIDSVRLSERE
jgi:hypothetical protein